MKKLYKVTLTIEERNQLETIASTGKNNAQKIKHPNILLAVDKTVNGKISDAEVAKRFHYNAKTVYNIRERFRQGRRPAVHHRRRTNQTQTVLSAILGLVGD